MSPDVSFIIYIVWSEQIVNKSIKCKEIVNNKIIKYLENFNIFRQSDVLYRFPTRILTSGPEICPSNHHPLQ